MKKIADAVSVMLILCPGRIFAALPPAAVLEAGALLGRAGYFLSGRHRKTARGNLEIAYGGGACPGRLAATARESFVNMGKGLFELLRVPGMSGPSLKKLVSLEGEENLARAVSAGRGVVGFSAHFGNFGLIGPRLALEGYGFSYVFRFPDFAALGAVIARAAERAGVGLIPSQPRTETVRGILGRLRGNEIVCILGDQHETEGAAVDFFGVPARTALGPVGLALRTGAAIVPVFARREKDDRHTVVIRPEVELEVSGDRGRDLIANTARLSRVVESFVREHPGQWWWMHRRWRDEEGGGK